MPHVKSGRFTSPENGWKGERGMDCKVFGVLMGVLSIAACGGGSGSSKTNQGPDNDEGKVGSGETMLDGVWVKECGPVEDTEGGSFYDVVTLTFQGHEFHSDIKNFMDASCITPMEGAPNPTASGDLSIGDEVVAESGLLAHELDTHITEYNGADFDLYDYTIFRIEINKLYLGKDTEGNDGDSSKARNKSLSFERIYYKQ